MPEPIRDNLVLVGDVRECLRQLPAESIHCVVTSPPYFGLRDYKTPPQVWGGDAACVHDWTPQEMIRKGSTNGRKDLGSTLVSVGAEKTLAPGVDNTVGETKQYRVDTAATCARCGAWRGHLGLEETPEAYVEHMVEVFREVRRVLRVDGTVWLNLGGRSGDASRHGRSRSGAPACGTGGRARLGSQALGCACSCHGDGRPGGWLSRRARNEYTDQPVEQARLPPSPTGRGSVPVGYGQGRLGDAPRAAPASTTRASLQRDLGASGQAATASAALEAALTCAACARGCASSAPEGHRRGTSAPAATSGFRSRGTASSGTACGDPQCGGCGVCWASLAIPALHVKPKDLFLVPAVVALALQADGWWVRSDIVWFKRNPLPESVKDRPTRAHEHIFLLVKSRRYFYDSFAVREPDAGRASGNVKRKVADGTHGRLNTHLGSSVPWEPGGGRNLRDVVQFAPKPYKNKAHCAVYPPGLPELAIKAGTSEAGCCAACGAPRERHVQTLCTATSGGGIRKHAAIKVNQGSSGALVTGAWNVKHTSGWRPTCAHDAPSAPCLVLDPFLGSGTTAAVAASLGQRFVGIELNPDYVPLIRERVGDAVAFEVVVAGRTVVPLHGREESSCASSTSSRASVAFDSGLNARVTSASAPARSHLPLVVGEDDSFPFFAHGDAHAAEESSQVAARGVGDAPPVPLPDDLGLDGGPAVEADDAAARSREAGVGHVPEDASIPEAASSLRLCPRCNDSKPVDTGFGYRNMRVVANGATKIVRRVQSWCRPCRSKKVSAKSSTQPTETTGQS